MHLLEHMRRFVTSSVIYGDSLLTHRMGAALSTTSSFATSAGNACREKLRNVAIIAHVDHGKTTLVDRLLRECEELCERDTDAERVMDSMDQEKERGITIMSKVTSVEWRGVRMNIVDTPGHADFGGEVERVLELVDGVVLVVDGTDGPNTQTRFVTSKALQRGLKPLVVINKADRDTADLARAQNEVFDLFLTLDATDAQMEAPFIYASAKDGWATEDDSLGKDHDRHGMSPLLDAILEHLPAPALPSSGADGALTSADFALLTTMMSHDPFLGRLLTGRVARGKLCVGEELCALSRLGDKTASGRVVKILAARGTSTIELEEAYAGDIVSIAGIPEAGVSDTLIHAAVVADGTAVPLCTHPIDPPTISMTFSVNDSPLSGQDGDKLNGQVLGDRLSMETNNNVSVTVQKAEGAENGAGAFEVMGRGELQLAVLLEAMRREGFEVLVSPPKVMFRDCSKTGQTLEPLEHVVADVEESHAGIVMERLSGRKGEMLGMAPSTDGRTRLEFAVPARALVGYRMVFTQDTRGTGVFNKTFKGWVPHMGRIETLRAKGSLCATEDGSTSSYALNLLEPRGVLFCGPGEKVYEGMIIGEHTRTNDLDVNCVKAKQLNNIRTVLKDDMVKLSPPRKFTLEEAMGYIRPDEMLEVTPNNLRLRKKYLCSSVRKRRARRDKSA
jgi:GTP-binding protein